jgi:hypothetical protein
MSSGHDADRIWNSYTPKQCAAFGVLARRRRREELREQFAITLIAVRGDKDQVKTLSKELGG